MEYSTTMTYRMKRAIFQYSQRISKNTAKDKQKLVADMIYGTLASGSCILSRMADALQESSKKKNVVERLSRKLAQGSDDQIHKQYLGLMKEAINPKGTVFVDDSDIVKPYGRKFEAMGLVRDGSEPEKRIRKGYHVTEITALTKDGKQPVSLYSHIHSSKETDYVSANDVTFKALREAFDIAPQATYVFDRGYDMNKLFSFMYQQKKEFILRLTEKRNLFFKGKWYKATTLRDSHKGKIKATVMFNGFEQVCYVSCLNVQITESKSPLRLILVYGLAATPMMLATNRSVTSKDDVAHIVRQYLSRWRIEEYFRFKKQHFGFERFRVRSLRAMNAMNHFIGYAISFLALVSREHGHASLKTAILENANAQREFVSFVLYRFGLGVKRILDHARTGIRGWFHVGRLKYRQLEMSI